MLKTVSSVVNAIGALNYQGTWDASTNNPTLTSSVGNKGDYYVVSVAGTTNLNGITDWQVNDWAIFNGAVWQKVDNTDLVVSVNGKTGAVVLTASDVGAAANTVNIIAGTGLSGGGNLTANVTLNIANTTVSAGSYGNASTVGSFTVDAQGRLTNAANNTISIAASQINSAIPNSGLANSTTTLGNATLTLGSTTTTVGNLSLGNANITSVAATFPNSYLANSSATIGNTAVTLGSTTSSIGNLALNNANITSVAVAFPNSFLANSTSTLGNATLTLGSTTSTVGNLTLNNVTINSGNSTVTNETVSYANITTAFRTVPLTGYLYGNANTGNVTAATTIPNSGLANSTATLGNATITLGSTTSTVGNLTLQNATISSVASTFPNSYLTNSAVTVNGVSISLGSSGTVTANTTGTLTLGTGLTGSSFNGSANVTANLANTTVSAATYGNAAIVGTFTVDAQGRLTAASNATISIPASAINTAIPNSGLANSSTTLGNATLTLGSTTSTVGNLTLNNATINSVASTFPNSFLANSSTTLGNTTLTLGSTATAVGNLTLNNVTINSVSTPITVSQGGTGLTSFTANGVVYASSTSALATGSALKFDGTNFATTGTSTGTKFIPTGGSATGNGMYLPASNTIAWSNNGAETMRLDSSGNLGLGVTPSAWDSGLRVFELPGGISLFWAGGPQMYLGTNWYYPSGGPFTYKTTAAATYYYQNAGAHRWYNAPSGTAGNTITFTQAMTLDASGNLLVGPTSTWTPPAGSGTSYNFFTNALTVGTSTTSVKFDVDRINFNAGNYYVLNESSTGVVLPNGNTSWSAQSDERLKDIIEPIDNGIEKVCSLRSVIGKYKIDKETKRRSFLIAQDVKAVLPEAVTEDADGYLLLGYSETIPLLVAAIKEQQVTIKDLLARVAALEGK